jgi:hypothetical protein
MVPPSSPAAGDAGKHLVELLLVHDRPTSVGRVGGVRRRRHGRSGRAGARELVVDAVLDVDAPGGRALLAGRPERAGVGGLDRAVEVGVGHHDQRVLAAELELDALAERGRLGAHLLADRDRSR